MSSCFDMLKLDKSIGLNKTAGLLPSRNYYPFVYAPKEHHQCVIPPEKFCSVFPGADNVLPDLMMDLSYKANSGALFNGISSTSNSGYNHKDSKTMISNEKPGITRPAKGLFSIRDLVKCDNEQQGN